MSAVLQTAIVFLVVATATIYSVLKFMPAARRRSVAAWAASWVQRSGVSEVTARRVEAKLASGGACGSCDSCKACATPTDAAPFRHIPIRQES